MPVQASGRTGITCWTDRCNGRVKQLGFLTLGCVPLTYVRKNVNESRGADAETRVNHGPPFDMNIVVWRPEDGDATGSGAIPHTT